MYLPSLWTEAWEGRYWERRAGNGLALDNGEESGQKDSSDDCREDAPLLVFNWTMLIVCSVE